MLIRLSDLLSRATERGERADLEGAIADFRTQQAQAASVLQQARSRESELSRALQIEQSQWDSLIADIE